MLLRVDATGTGDSVVVRAAGEIDLGTVALLRGPLQDAVRSGSGRVVVDLCAVDYLDCTALGLLVGTHQQLAAVDRSLVLRTSAPRVLALLRLAGLTRLLTVEAESGRVSSAPPSADPAGATA